METNLNENLKTEITLAIPSEKQEIDRVRTMLKVYGRKEEDPNFVRYPNGIYKKQNK